MRNLESQEQQALFQWAELNKNKYPELGLMFHIPNGGKRNITTAVRLKKEGVKSGIPDIFLPTARGNYHGLFIEMKAGKNPETANQLRWIAELTLEGYKATTCRGWERAKDVILDYLRLSEGNN